MRLPKRSPATGLTWLSEAVPTVGDACGAGAQAREVPLRFSALCRHAEPHPDELNSPAAVSGHPALT